MPHFFIYAKDKTKNQVEPINDSIVNKFTNTIPETPIKFDFKGGDSTVPKFYYKHLLCNKKFKFDENSQFIINTYFDLCKRSRDFGKVEIEDGKKNPYNSFVYKRMADEMLGLGFDSDYIVDTLVTSLYKDVPKTSTQEEQKLYRKNTSQKDMLWYMFGEIILKNIKQNVEKIEVKVKYCERCGKIIGKTNNRAKYCVDCSRIVNREKQKSRNKKARDKNGNN